jgi:hypothetical protein
MAQMSGISIVGPHPSIIVIGWCPPFDCQSVERNKGLFFIAAPEKSRTATKNWHKSIAIME